MNAADSSPNWDRSYLHCATREYPQPVMRKNITRRTARTAVISDRVMKTFYALRPSFPPDVPPPVRQKELLLNILKTISPYQPLRNRTTMNPDPDFVPGLLSEINHVQITENASSIEANEQTRTVPLHPALPHPESSDGRN